MRDIPQGHKFCLSRLAAQFSYKLFFCTALLLVFGLALMSNWLVGCSNSGSDSTPPASNSDTPSDNDSDTPTVTNTWIWLGGPIGGKGYDIRMSPDDPDTMYVTDMLAGIFKSTDGGQNWSPINEGINVRAGLTNDQIPVFCATIDPNDGDTVWVGMSGTRGLFKSTDGGQNWTARENGIVESAGLTFRGITIDPNSSDTVYAAGVINGIYLSTDGGSTWPSISAVSTCRMVAIDPANSNNLIGGVDAAF
ncbi:MAG: hypothetical protein KKB30_03430 [Proteobacteria bacterium]|nr:hypothetical protein [Pseudomonadota bacterium]MBU1715044.1 hypothetical protein [Pseudomonadota bacterium]